MNPMTSAIAHHAHLLAEHYTWMPGGDTTAVSAEGPSGLHVVAAVRP